ncbi:RagB/SusD family nutrient uptake outer membrane protein [Chitinophaga sp. Cy-1792]|uniref:RagB/SusD family nutrient uptake outer membrane protein n=1 Tax=Chitinophaga sp. Cy-1792 TaxID=2608339 RepID=UPI0014218FAF|nr:RagB/SusD family nutrient uptake outer membrane protein [Chitinophaga sp. Cy-1792]NIG55501.1 SusD/RagB family nutrient-binding outer membrane lipoprotein [Chitinophaga sp. Cy-1792]
MKFPNKVKGVWALMLMLVAGFTACTKNFEKYNTDNTGISGSELGPDFNGLGLFLKSAQMSIINFSGGGDPNSYQLQQNLNADIFSGYFMSATPFASGINNTNYALVNGWNGETYKVGYLNIMSPIMKLKATGIEQNYPAVWAVALIVKVAGMSRVTDVYGPIPYSHVGENAPTIPYDSQQDIYKRFFLELDTATQYLQAQLTSGKALPFDFGQFDLVYGGNFAQWLRFANSLRLRLATHINYVDKATAKTEGEKALNPANGGVISDNSDNMNVKITGSFTNPLVFIATDWADIRINASLACFLNGYKDPRISKYLDKSTDPSFPSQYIGIRVGGVTSNNVKDDYVKYSNLNVSDGASPFFSKKTSVQLMTAAEVYFLRAEATLNGWANTGGSAQQLYEQGVSTSFAQWGVSDATYLNNDTSIIARYVDPKNHSNDTISPSKITIKWNEGGSTEEKLERVITQKWIAMFPEGQEAWTEFRRTGYPQIFPVAHNNSGGTINTTVQIRRLPFPQNEYTTNPATVADGVKLLGGPDNGGTKLWWDAKNK